MMKEVYLQCTWSVDWKLSFNEMKCILLSFYSKCPQSQHKDLGIVMSHDLSWSSHLSVIANHAYKKLGLLRRTFSSVTSVSTKKRLFLSLVRPGLSIVLKSGIHIN